jgi:surface carbohydrate biosynthesis protein
MTDKKKTVIFSIEIAARELDSKCLLALEAAKSGMRVYIGSFRALKQLDGKIDECIFFHKSTWKKNAERLRKTIGAHFVFLDEEMGLALPRSELRTYLAARYTGVSSENYSHSFAIGDAHKTSMDTLDNFNGVEVHALGWPRLDLWREPFHQLYKSEVERIHRGEGHFYLLVSSFGAISESTYQESIDSHIEHYSDDTTVIDFKYDEFKSCLKLIEGLSPKLNTDEKIVVRPHTSESTDEWEQLLAPYPNVVIRHEGDITPWLLAAKGTIQFGSTVAVQAAFMGIPSIQLETEKEVPGLTDTTAYEVLESAQSADEILAFLRNAERQAPEVHRKNAISKLEGLVSNLDGSMASTEIANVLNGVEIAPQAPIRFGCLRRFLFWFKERINYMNYLKSKLLNKEHTRIKRSKFEKIPNGLTTSEIGDKVRDLATILGDDPKRIKCRQVAHNLVEIEFD